ncbi:MAG: type III PLP-dependent enzyme [Gammaproteobacteria bacterium]|nr:type III PLP-dependent enzyme [Gammaproteobacteria bacterium]
MTVYEPPPARTDALPESPAARLGEARWAKMRALAETKDTPFVVIDLDVVRERYFALHNEFPQANIYYAVKANPAVEIIRLLRDQGGCFDIASIYELDKVLAEGVRPERISYGNTIKKRKDIEYFYAKGVRLYATDSEADLANIAELAPGAKVYARILVDGSEGADWPLSKKFGCTPDKAVELLIKARALGLAPHGLSFHVGSQQRDLSVWPAALAKVKAVFDTLASCGIQLRLVNLGGGFPARYRTATPELSDYCGLIRRSLEQQFGEQMPELIFEPGRSLVGDAGVLVSEVVLVARKGTDPDPRWVYTDIGKFGGLIETLDEAIKYPIYTDRVGPVQPVVLAGPTCDSMDILYEHAPYSLPLSLAAGDRMYWGSTGAYTTSYSAVEFNGFPPLKAYYLDSARD